MESNHGEVNHLQDTLPQVKRIEPVEIVKDDACTVPPATSDLQTLEPPPQLTTLQPASKCSDLTTQYGSMPTNLNQSHLHQPQPTHQQQAPQTHMPEHTDFSHHQPYKPQMNFQQPPAPPPNQYQFPQHQFYPQHDLYQQQQQQQQQYPYDSSYSMPSQGYDQPEQYDAYQSQFYQNHHQYQPPPSYHNQSYQLQSTQMQHQQSIFSSYPEPTYHQLESPQTMQPYRESHYPPGFDSPPFQQFSHPAQYPPIPPSDPFQLTNPFQSPLSPPQTSSYQTNNLPSSSSQSTSGQQTSQAKGKGTKRKGGASAEAEAAKEDSKDGSGDELDNKKKIPRRKQFERKNIRDILDNTELEAETVAAQKEEQERKRRLHEAQQRALMDNLNKVIQEAEQQESLKQAEMMRQQQQQHYHMQQHHVQQQMHHHHQQQQQQQQQQQLAQQQQPQLPPYEQGLSPTMNIDQSIIKKEIIDASPMSSPTPMSTTHMPVLTPAVIPSTINNIKKEEVILLEGAATEQDDQKKQIIQVFPPNNTTKPNIIRPVVEDQKKKIIKVYPQKVNPVISISSSEESSSSSSSSSTSGEEDDDVVMVLSENEGDEEVDEDPNNSGSHTNDLFNQPDQEGRVMVNVGHPPEEKDLFLAPQLSRAVKPHQIGGIRFLYDNVIESTLRFQTSSGFGCILAHSMGLGKTIQVISFVDIFLRHTSARTVLCIVPINTIQNWMAEFDMWLPQKEAVPQLLIDSNEIFPRTFPVFLINDNYKSLTARAKALTEWKEKGGVVLMGYEMYRMLALKKLTKVVSRKRKNKKKEDIPPSDTNTDDDPIKEDVKLLDEIFLNLVNPGPDLVVCDEGHRIKNCSASTSTALKKIHTKRRVVLTGYPLQNSLLEYWCMVDFVRPNYLGSRSEFCNMFERPIQNGQCIDSTPKDRQLMRYRAHVLHSLLEGFVQRRGHAVLRCTLPVKEEHVLLIRMTPVQRLLYREFVKDFHSRSNSTNPLLFFAVCCKIWNHPDVLYNFVKNQKHQGLPENDLDIENFVAPTPITPEKTSAYRKPAMEVKDVVGQLTNDNSQSSIPETSTNLLPVRDAVNHQSNENSESSVPEAVVNCENKVAITPEINSAPIAAKERADSLINYEWANILMANYKPGVLENSYKMHVLFCIIDQSLAVGDKLLVFSQSLLTLDLIERFLADRYMPMRPGFPPGERWMKNHNYCRLDGKTHAQERERLINCFNRSPTMFLFLLSTRAGCLGINLIGANRIVVFDASWNPCHDAQAVCRIYRYGQQKQCFIYRLVTDNCLEKKVYDRQINKQGMSDRVVDELSPESNFTWKEVSTLVSEEEDDVPEQDYTTVLPKLNDHVLKYLCSDLSKTLSKEPFEHESLLLDRKDLKLTKQEKKLAKQSYEMEKKGGFGRYNNNYYRGGILRPPFPHGTTVRGNVMYASHGMSGGTRFLPSQTTPVPMQPGQYRPPNRNNNNSTVLIRALLHQGVMVRRVTPSNDLNVSMSSGESNMVTIPAGQEVLVMRTPKGVYLRVPDGRIIAVRLPPELLSQWQAIGTTTTVGTGDPPAPRNIQRTGNAALGKGQFGNQIVQQGLQCGGSVKVNAGKKGDEEGQPEVINLSDEDENGTKKVASNEGGTSLHGNLL